jgi:hypothetical protein
MDRCNTLAVVWKRTPVRGDEEREMEKYGEN